MLRYSDRATHGSVRLYKRFNEVNIFVEDETYTKIYEIYFSRILEGHAKIRKIFSLNGRNNVISECNRGDLARKHHPCIFLIDGDLDLLTGNSPAPHPHLYQLQVYCLENLLVSEVAAIEVAYESCSEYSKKELGRKISFRQWQKTVVQKLFPLFVVYAIAHELGVPGQNASARVERLVSGRKNDRRIDDVLISRWQTQIENRILATIPRRQFLERAKQIRAFVGRKLEHRFRCVGGKNYLIPLLSFLMRNNARFRDSEESLKVRLSKYSSLDIDAGLRARVLAALPS